MFNSILYHVASQHMSIIDTPLKCAFISSEAFRQSSGTFGYFLAPSEIPEKLSSTHARW